MKKSLTIIWALATIYITGFAQTIELHSIATSRMPGGDTGYTLDGLRMTGSRSKLSNPANFGMGGTYEKFIIISDEYYASGSLTSISSSQLDLLYFGTFNTVEPSLEPFNNDELDSLYQWSLRGGKMIIGPAAVAPQYNYYPDILNSRWGFDLTLNLGLTGTDFYSTPIGQTSKIFDGPFGSISSAHQGGAVKGYFNTIPVNSIVLATDTNGNPNLILDCTTLDLILADGDGHNDLGGVTTGSMLLNANDIFWANTIAYMDSMESPPQIIQVGNQLSTGSYSSYQWYINGNLMPGETSDTHIATQSGSYTVQVSLDCGCNNVSSPAAGVSVGLDENVHLPQIVFGPNPLKNELITFKGITQHVTVSLYNPLGVMVYKTQLNNQASSCHTGNLKAGVYFIKIMDEKNNVLLNKKIIKQ